MPDPRVVRTLSLIGADGAGKTALAEALIRFAEPGHAHPSGSTTRLDAEPEEKKRNFSLGIHPLSFESVSRSFNILDCPGFSSFLPDVERALHVTDGAVFVVSAATGAHKAAERLYDAVANSKRPCIAALSRLDHERADFSGTIADIEASLKLRPVLVHLPIRAGGALWGIVDVGHTSKRASRAPVLWPTS